MTKIHVFPEVPSTGSGSYGSLESQGEYDSQWTAICSIALKIRLYTGDSASSGYSSMSRMVLGAVMAVSPPLRRQRLKELERENRELSRSNDILRRASTYFAKAEFDRPGKIMPTCWISRVSSAGSDRYAVNCILPRQRITTVSNSDIIPINAMPVRSVTG